MTTSIKFATPTGENIINFPSAGGSTYTFPSATGTILTNDSTVTLTNKTLIGATNTIEASGLRTNGASITISGATPPSINQVLKATSATTATWQDDYAGEGGGIYNATAPLDGADANGIIIDNILSEMTLQYTNATYPGIVSVAAQTFAGTKTFNNNVNLVTTTSAAGTITIAGTRFIHAYGTYNVFVGATSGNYTLSGTRNVGVGGDVLKSLTSGSSNVAMGDFSMSLCTSGIQNTALGLSSMINLTTGSYNTAVGKGSMQNTTTAGSNTCVGESSGININTTFGNTCIGVTSSTSGDSNTYVGYSSGDGSYGNSTTTIYNSSLGYESLKKTEGGYNIGIGYRGGYNLTTGSNNLCIGHLGVAAETGIIRIGTSGTHTATHLVGTVNIPTATISGVINLPTTSSTAGIIYKNSERFIHAYGSSNQFVGANAGNFTTTGSNNTGIGLATLQSLTSGFNNNCVGLVSMQFITTGHSNNFMGVQGGYSLTTGVQNVGMGSATLSALITGINNVCVGHSAGSNYTSSESNNVCIGSEVYGTIGESHTIRIGNSSHTTTYIAGIIQSPSIVGNMLMNGQIIFRVVSGGYTDTYIGHESGNTIFNAPNTVDQVFMNGTGVGTRTELLRISAGTGITVGNYINLPTTTSTVGRININSNRFIHSYGTGSSFIGNESGNFTYTGAGCHTGVGHQSLYSLTSGIYNTAVGHQASKLLTTGNQNVTMGVNSGIFMTTGSCNVLLGYYAGVSIQSGNFNVCIGNEAGTGYGTSESNNICIGAGVTGTTSESNVIRLGGTQTITHLVGTVNIPTATVAGVINLPTTTSSVGSININSVRFMHAYGSNNTFLGNNAGNFTSTGVGCNTGIGHNSLSTLTSGAYNTGYGYASLGSCTTGSENTAVGLQAGSPISTGLYNTLLGYNACALLTTGNSNTCLGHSAGVNYTSSETNNINIGAGIYGNNGESNVTRIGGSQTRCYIGGIRGRTSDVADAITTLISSTGQLCTVSSDRRLKENFDYNITTEAMAIIRDLKPCKFNYKSDIVPKLVWGLIADEAAGVIPDYVVKLHGPKTRPLKQVVNKITKKKDKINAEDADEFEYIDKIEFVEDTEPVPELPEDNDHTIQYHMLPIIMLTELQRIQTVVKNMQDIIDAQQILINSYLIKYPL